MEETVFESEGRMERAEIAEYLRAVAESLDRGATVTFTEGEESVSLDVPAEPEFEVAVEHEGPEGAMTERSIELEIEWDEAEEGQEAAGGELTVE
ncbi:amphi-Trp domain-containing protein [Salinarchaeum laminariae]|uniref:amphi-Trp domain-containing protein n=1 Tax=Salinarchaeum laminariae TaxID=869888 RepID=UPI0020C09126|nr:amphi-Trp domain-containing protein [Salinarchaeum laminariae]